MADKKNNQSSGGGDKKEGKKPAASLPPLKIREPAEEDPATTPTSAPPVSPSIPVTTPPAVPDVREESSLKRKAAPSGGNSPLAPVEERTCPICGTKFLSPQAMRGHLHKHDAEDRKMHFGSPKQDKQTKVKYQQWKATNSAIRAATEPFTIRAPPVKHAAVAAAVAEAVRGSSSSFALADQGSGDRRLLIDVNELPPVSPPSSPPSSMDEELAELNRNRRRRPLNFDCNCTPPRDRDNDDDADQRSPPAEVQK